MTTETRPPLPPFTRETAEQKVRMAEEGWNSRDRPGCRCCPAIRALSPRR